MKRQLTQREIDFSIEFNQFLADNQLNLLAFYEEFKGDIGVSYQTLRNIRQNKSIIKENLYQTLIKIIRQPYIRGVKLGVEMTPAQYVMEKVRERIRKEGENLEKEGAEKGYLPLWFNRINDFMENYFDLLARLQQHEETEWKKLLEIGSNLHYKSLCEMVLIFALWYDENNTQMVDYLTKIPDFSIPKELEERVQYFCKNKEGFKEKWEKMSQKYHLKFGDYQQRTQSEDFHGFVVMKLYPIVSEEIEKLIKQIKL